MKSPPLAATWRGGTGNPASCRWAVAASNRASWSRVRPGSSLAWRCVHRPASLVLWVAGDRRGSGCEGLGRETTATHPGLHLELDIERLGGVGGLGGRDGVQEVRQELRVPARHRHAVAGRLPGERDRDGIEHADRDADPAGPKRQRLIECGHAEPVRAGGLEGEGHRHGTVSVRVGLDHGVDRDGWPREGAERGQVAPQRVEVDLQPGRAGERRQAGRRKTLLDRAHVRLTGSVPGGVAGLAVAARRSREPNPRPLAPCRRSARPARRFRATARPSGRSDASRPESP